MEENREADPLNTFSAYSVGGFGNAHLHKARVKPWLEESLKLHSAPSLPSASARLRVKPPNPSLSQMSQLPLKSGKLDLGTCL